MKKSSLIAGAAVAVLLAGCGGGGGGDAMPAPPAATDAVPASASQSVAGMMGYLVALAAAMADEKEALDVSAFAPPQPDDAEPATVQ
jgi:hypothetical protein